MIGPGQAPTRAALLELKNEQAVVNEAYVFLDEKRLLLAAELLKQLRRYRRMNDELSALQAEACDAMQHAVMHHGLNGLQVYPAASLDAAEVDFAQRNFMGVTLVDSGLTLNDQGVDHPPACNPSAEAERCRRLFLDIVDKSAVLAGVSGNLHRLLTEYRVTERRSRALENVILPEIEQSLREMSSHLEELDLEDAIRVRSQAASLR